MMPQLLNVTKKLEVLWSRIIWIFSLVVHFMHHNNVGNGNQT
jgi:hypothetical protein